MKGIIKKIILLFFVIFIGIAIVNAEEENFKLEGYELISYNQIYLTFNNNIYNSDEIEYTFSLINKYDSFDDLFVEYYELDEEKGNKILLTFDDNMQVGGEYELMVIDILDENGNNIESGIDSIVTFIVPEEIIVIESSEEEATRIAEEEATRIAEEEATRLAEEEAARLAEEENINLNSATEEELNSGEEVSVNFVENNVISESQDVVELPTTGPEHIFILLLSFIIVSFGFVYKIKKS